MTIYALHQNVLSLALHAAPGRRGAGAPPRGRAERAAAVFPPLVHVTVEDRKQRKADIERSGLLTHSAGALHSRAA